MVQGRKESHWWKLLGASRIPDNAECIVNTILDTACMTSPSRSVGDDTRDAAQRSMTLSTIAGAIRSGHSPPLSCGSFASSIV